MVENKGSIVTSIKSASASKAMQRNDRHLEVCEGVLLNHESYAAALAVKAVWIGPIPKEQGFGWRSRAVFGLFFISYTQQVFDYQ